MNPTENSSLGKSCFGKLNKKFNYQEFFEKVKRNITERTDLYLELEKNELFKPAGYEYIYEGNRWQLRPGIRKIINLRDLDMSLEAMDNITSHAHLEKSMCLSKKDKVKPNGFFSI